MRDRSAHRGSRPRPALSYVTGSITLMASRGVAGRETGNYGPFNAQLPVGRAVADLAAGGTKIDVTIPGRVPRALPGMVIHRSTTLTEADTSDVDGIPCTTVARTPFDLADVTRRRGLERAFDQSEILEASDLIAIQE